MPTSSYAYAWLNVFFILILCLNTVPCRKMLLLYLPGPEIPTWTINVFTCHANVSWTSHSYIIFDTSVPRSDSHKDLGLILSEDLCWDKHYKAITICAYKLLGLICTILFSHLTFIMVGLYASLVWSQLLYYCTQIWCSHLMKDILNIEHVQLHATNYILNDYISCYKTCFIKLKLFP